MKSHRFPMFLILCLSACVLAVAIPLISEITGQGRGGQASRESQPTIEPPVSQPHQSDTASASDTEPPIPLRPNDSVTSDPSATETRPPSQPEGLPSSLKVLLHESGETVTMSSESYLVGVVAAEMPCTFHPEALKAQAVAARTYCLYRITHGVTHENGADVCTDFTHCAAYLSEDMLTERYGSTVTARILQVSRQAVEATAEEILLYGGEPILALFHARSYQRTESSDAVWGGVLPYLVSVTTPEEDSLSTVMVTREQLLLLFSASDTVVSNSMDPQRLLAEHTSGGRVSCLFYDGKGLKATVLRERLGLSSCDFEYEETEQGWLFTVHGSGHGVGMSQYGANEMAKHHADYEQILTHYYTGVILVKPKKVPFPVGKGM